MLRLQERRLICLVLINAFILNGTASVYANTLSPAVNIQSISLKTDFSLSFQSNVAGYSEFNDEETIDPSKSQVEIPEGSRPAVTSSGETQGPVLEIYPPPSAPPPPMEGNVHSSFYNLLRTALPYPFTKKKLEEDIQELGFSLIDNDLSRQQALTLLLSLETDRVFQDLAATGVKEIRYEPALIEKGTVTNTAVEIEKNSLIVTDVFLVQKPSVRQKLFRGVISRLNPSLTQYPQFEANSSTIKTLKQMGLPPETDELMREINVLISNYNSPGLWPGFSMVGFWDNRNDPGASMITINKDYLHFEERKVGLGMSMVPILIKLQKTDNELFREVILTILTHEGGITGHLMRWPFQSLEEAGEIFNWHKLTNSQALNLVMSFNRRLWTDVLQKGTPPFDSWLQAAIIIRRTLKEQGYPEVSQNGQGPWWAEFQAQHGMFLERGLRSVSVLMWFYDDFCGQTINYPLLKVQQFPFLSDKEWKQCQQEKKRIQKNYARKINPSIWDKIVLKLKPAAPAAVFALTSGMLLTPTVVHSATQFPAAVANAGLFMGATAVSTAVLFSRAWRVLGLYRMKSLLASLRLKVLGVTQISTVTKKTEQTMARVSKEQDTDSLVRFYQKADYSKKIEILDTVRRNYKMITPALARSFISKTYFAGGETSKGRRIRLSQLVGKKDYDQTVIDKQFFLLSLTAVRQGLKQEEGLSSSASEFVMNALASFSRAGYDTRRLTRAVAPFLDGSSPLGREVRAALFNVRIMDYEFIPELLPQRMSEEVRQDEMNAARPADAKEILNNEKLPAMANQNGGLLEAAI